MVINKNLRIGVIKSYLNGLLRSDIAAKFGISTGSVSNITREYEEALAIVDLTTIRKSLKAFHKRDFTVKEFTPLSQFINILEESYETKGLRDSIDFKSFLRNSFESATNFYKFCHDYSILPDIIPLWIKDLQDFIPNLQAISIKSTKLATISEIAISNDTPTPLTRNLSRNTKTPRFKHFDIY